MNDKALEWAISYFETMAADMMLAEADPELCDMVGVASQGLRELQERRSQTCATCKTQQGCLVDGWPAHDGFYCGHWQAKEANDGN